MTNIILSRRKFLVGLATTTIAIPATAKLLKAPPLLPSIAENWQRSAYRFYVLPDIADESRRITVTFIRSHDTKFIQLEMGHIPSSFIPTHSAAATRQADNVCIPLSSYRSVDFTDNETPFKAFSDYLTRDSPAFAVSSSGQLQRFEPNQPRITNEGLLTEPRATNLLLHTAPNANPWMSQTVSLQPGAYSISWFGAGKVKVVGEQVWLYRGTIS